MAIIEVDLETSNPFEQDVAATQRYFDSPRFDGIIRLYSARQVVEQLIEKEQAKRRTQPVSGIGRSRARSACAPPQFPW